MTHRRATSRTSASLCLLALALGCSTAPTREDVTPAIEGSTPRTPPWLDIQAGFGDSNALASYMTEVSGYARLVFAGASPDWADTSQIVMLGPINPAVRLADADGDGRLDPGGDMDVFSPDPGGSVLVWGGAANAGRTVRVGVILYTFQGWAIQETWADDPVLLEPRAEPLEVKFGPVGLPPEATACYDGDDNDGDGWIDFQDADCRGGGTLSERGLGATTCSDGQDNDDDGLADADDPDCRHGGDLSEAPSCSDGLDDDGDTWTDAADPDCAGGDEQGFGATECNDGVDNDGDSFIDAFDPECISATSAE